jgi:hypothetical protein
MAQFSRGCRPSPRPSAKLGRLRAAFDRAGYTEPGIRELLRAAGVPAFRQRLEALPHHLWATRVYTGFAQLSVLSLVPGPGIWFPGPHPPNAATAARRTS